MREMCCGAVWPRVGKRVSDGLRFHSGARIAPKCGWAAAVFRDNSAFFFPELRRGAKSRWDRRDLVLTATDALVLL